MENGSCWPVVADFFFKDEVAVLVGRLESDPRSDGLDVIS